MPLKLSNHASNSAGFIDPLHTAFVRDSSSAARFIPSARSRGSGLVVPCIAWPRNLTRSRWEQRANLSGVSRPCRSTKLRYASTATEERILADQKLARSHLYSPWALGSPKSIPRSAAVIGVTPSSAWVGRTRVGTFFFNGVGHLHRRSFAVKEIGQRADQFLLVAARFEARSALTF